MPPPGAKICWDTVFVLGQYLFLEAHSLPRVTLSENCSLLGADTWSADKYRSICLREMEAIVLFIAEEESSQYMQYSLVHFGTKYSLVISNFRTNSRQEITLRYKHTVLNL